MSRPNHSCFSGARTAVASVRTCQDNLAAWSDAFGGGEGRNQPVMRYAAHMCYKDPYRVVLSRLVAQPHPMKKLPCCLQVKTVIYMRAYHQVWLYPTPAPFPLVINPIGCLKNDRQPRRRQCLQGCPGEGLLCVHFCSYHFWPFFFWLKLRRTVFL